MSRIASAMKRVATDADLRPTQPIQPHTVPAAVARSCVALTAVAVVALVAVIVVHESARAAETAAQPAATTLRQTTAPSQSDMELRAKLDRLTDLVRDLAAQTQQRPQAHTPPHRKTSKGDPLVTSLATQIDALTRKLSQGSDYADKMERIIVRSDMQMHTPADVQLERQQKGLKP